MLPQPSFWERVRRVVDHPLAKLGLAAIAVITFVKDFGPYIPISIRFTSPSYVASVDLRSKAGYTDYTPATEWQTNGYHDYSQPIDESQPLTPKKSKRR